MGLDRYFTVWFQHPDREPLDDEAYIQRIIDEMVEVTCYDWEDAKQEEPAVSVSGVNWYKCIDDMEYLSKEFPDVLFFLHCDGMGLDDIWEAGFLNGCYDIAVAEIPELNYQYLRRAMKTNEDRHHPWRENMDNLTNRHLELEIRINNGYVDLDIYEPETGECTKMHHPFSPDEHPAFNEAIGNAIYDWLKIWGLEGHMEDVICE